MTFLRLRLARRLGLLGPTLRLQRRVEEWATAPHAAHQPAFATAPRRHS